MPAPTPSSPSLGTTAARDKAYSAYEASLANKRGAAAAAARRRPRFDEGYAKDLAYRLNEDFPMWSKRAPGSKPSRFPELDALSDAERDQLAALFGVLALRRQIDAPHEHRSGTVYALGTKEYAGSDSEFFVNVLRGEWEESLGFLSDEELLKLRVYYGIGVIPTIPCMFWSNGEQYMHAAANLAAYDTQHAPDLTRALILEETTLLRKRMRARGGYVGAFWPDADAAERDVVQNFLTFFAANAPLMACAFPDWEFMWSDEPDEWYDDDSDDGLDDLD